LVSINIENLETAQAVLSAAAEKGQPLLVALSERTLDYASPGVYVALINAIAKTLPVRYAIHLDHATTIDTVKRCLQAGFNSVMFDGSFHSYEENIFLTKEVVVLAKEYHAAVEGELGHVGGKKDLSCEKESLLTDPNEAADFVKRTGVDSLAISIGNSHGFYQCVPNIHFDVLEAIREKVTIPLVLHGASGLSDEVVRRCVALGISRLNFCTELRDSFSQAVKNELSRDPNLVDPKKYLGPGRKAFHDHVYRIFEALEGQK